MVIVSNSLRVLSNFRIISRPFALEILTNYFSPSSHSLFAIFEWDEDDGRMIECRSLPPVGHNPRLVSLIVEYRVPLCLLAYAMCELPALQTLQLGNPKS
jgi:hypothetical protein